MPKAAVIVPFPFGANGLSVRAQQKSYVKLAPDLTVDYLPLTAGPAHFIGRHDEFLIEMAVFEAGIKAAEAGYDAITVDSLSDSGIPELRSVLDIPVVSNGRSAMLYALSLGARFSIVFQDDPHYPQYRHAGLEFYKNLLKKFEMSQFCASLEIFEADADYENLFTGREAEVFPKIEEACQRGIAAGAHVIILGSTTLHQSGPYLAERLPVPVVNPGATSLKMIDTVLSLGHRQSRVGFPKPAVTRSKMIHAMLEAAKANQTADDD